MPGHDGRMSALPSPDSPGCSPTRPGGLLPGPARRPRLDPASWPVMSGCRRPPRASISPAWWTAACWPRSGRAGTATSGWQPGHGGADRGPRLAPGPRPGVAPRPAKNLRVRAESTPRPGRVPATTISPGSSAWPSRTRCWPGVWSPTTPGSPSPRRAWDGSPSWTSTCAPCGGARGRWSAAAWTGPNAARISPERSAPRCADRSGPPLGRTDRHRTCATGHPGGQPCLPGPARCAAHLKRPQDITGTGPGDGASRRCGVRGSGPRPAG